MRFDIVTIFPEFFAGPLDYGIVCRARESGLIDIGITDLRAFAHDRHRSVDDRPFGGGEGMVLKPEPLFEAVESLLGCSAPTRNSATSDSTTFDSATHDSATSSAARADSAASANSADTSAAGISGAWPPARTAVILLSASGKLFRQPLARKLAGLDRVVFLCGRYEGVDERVAEHLATEELSIGDFVLSGGELAAALVIDAVTRLIPGALGNEASAIHESFSAARSDNAQTSMSATCANEINAAAQITAASRARISESTDSFAPILLDFPHYTRPADFRGWGVPETLMGGNHEEIRRWRERMALEKTRRNRPDLLDRK
jgi:tRNA (guanine37-N1)-methyltransferase